MPSSIDEVIAQRRARTAESVKAPEDVPKALAPAREEVHTPGQLEAGKSVPTRKRRNIFNGTQAKLSVNQLIPGYHLHVLTDVGNRIQEAMDGGYEFVSPDEVGGVSENVVSRNGDLGDRVRFLVNPRAEGSEQFGYLMKIREEWWSEDQQALQAKNSQIDLAIRKGKITGDNPNFYVPQGGISVK